MADRALEQLRREPHDPVETLLPRSIGDSLLTHTYIKAQVVAATTPGTVVGKIAVRDRAGTVLGYLPVYNAIT